MKDVSKNAFACNVRIGYSDLDDKTTLRPSKLVGILQNAAISHSNTAGYDLNWFLENGRGWALLLWHIRIARLPGEGEELEISTWAKPYKRAQANRDFLMRDSSGEEVCYASSRWVLLDTHTRRPIKFKEEFFASYLYASPRDFREENFQMPGGDEEKILLSQRQIRVTRRDTDFNGHANNVAYVDWSLDDVPHEIYEGYRITDIRVEYKKECLPGALVESHCYVRDLASDRKEILSIFTNAAAGEPVHGMVSTIWQRP
ncbi:MAG: acyl-[acyl-carrier-protein] thioesterase [Anaerovoracaceae bacterium]|jgi:medium-chain acyl-[acyl-carrier-protein] hydrolase